MALDNKNKTPAPTIIVLFGATGDLTFRKIIPSLFHLFLKKQLPRKIHVRGFSRRHISDSDFRKIARESLTTHVKNAVSETATQEFLTLLSYTEGNFDTEKDYVKLATDLRMVDDLWGTCTNKLFYLAVPPHLYETILKNIHVAGLTSSCGDPNWARVIIEKPFGKDLKTARNIDRVLGGTFKEEQIYRIDHYLGKEIVQNILVFRFSNNIFAEVWNNNSIETIEIKLNEVTGVQDRGEFYDEIGALRDVGQNHLLQLLSLLTMKDPGDFSASSIRNARLQALKKINLTPRGTFFSHAFRAQYADYRKLKNVGKQSQTETYFKIKLTLASSLFRGVPIFLEGGKKCAREEKEVVVTFKHEIPCLCPKGIHYKNKIIFHLSHPEGITILFYSKKPGHGMEIEPRKFAFHFHEPETKHERIEEYERLLLDTIRGDQTLFVQTDEVEAMWKFIDPIVEAWEQNKVPLETYAAGTDTMRDLAKKILGI